MKWSTGEFGTDLCCLNGTDGLAEKIFPGFADL
jgi:hypothetical protein